MAELLGVIATVGGITGVRWLWHLRKHPFGRCWWCGGTGQNRGSIRKRYGRCKHCSRGERVRVGAGLVRPDLRKGARKR
jgi:hypothetical protein